MACTAGARKPAVCRAAAARAPGEQFVAAPPRQRPDLLTAAQIRRLPGQARAEYQEQRSVWHANPGPLRTPQMRTVHEHLDDIVEANRQDGTRSRAPPCCTAGPAAPTRKSPPGSPQMGQAAAASPRIPGDPLTARSP